MSIEETKRAVSYREALRVLDERRRKARAKAYREAREKDEADCKAEKERRP